MAQYLDKAGLDALWTKIKGTFVAKTIKKSDSSNATQITHDGDTVSLSRGTISGTGNTSTYTASSSIDIGADDIITFTSTSRPQYRVEENRDLIPMAFLRDIPKVDTALDSTSTNPVQNKVVTSALNGKSNTGHKHSYNDLTDKPTIGDAKITIRQNGTEKGSFTLNQTSSKAIDLIDTTYVPATTSTSGLMSATDKTKLDGIATGANKTTVDTTLSSTSTNPVQNKVIFTALNNKLDTSVFNIFKGLKGQANGLAELNSDGRVPSSQLPSYVDDVIEGYYYNSKFYEEESHTTEITGESGKIYTDLGSNKTYRWSGTIYTEISASLALGETSSTAYPGNKGAANAANIKTNTNNIKALQGYFDNGKAIYAINDASGNVITETYAKKSDLSSVAQNASAKIDKSVLTAKGDIIYASAASTPAKLAIGVNGKVLKVVNGIPAWSDDNNTHNSHIVYSGKKADGTTDISSGTASSGNITLGDSGVTAGNYGDTSNQTPSYGNAFKVPSLTVNAKGIVTGIATHTVKIPANNATTSAAGLMSSSDKTKLDNFEGAISVDYINNQLS